MLIWPIRVVLLLYLLLPSLGALRPITGLNTGGRELIEPGVFAPEVKLILQNAAFALEMSIAAAAVFMAFVFLFVKREATSHLNRLVLILTALFFVPATLKAFAFHRLWGELEMFGVPPKVLFFLWTLSFNTVFFWGALLAFINLPSARSTIDSLFESALPRERYFWLLRLVLPPTFVAWTCCFAFTLFAGLELRLLVPTVKPIGETIDSLFGGQDVDAARLSLLAMLAGLLLTAVVCGLGRRTWEQR